MEKEFNEQDSLRIINEMINQAKNNFKRSSSTLVLFWGYLVSLIAIANFVLLRALDNPVQSFWVWSATAVGWVVSFFIQRNIDRTAIVKTHIDAIIKYIWLGFGISMTVLLVIFWTLRLEHNAQFVYLTPLSMIMSGLAQFATAIACRYKPYYWGAVVFWLGAIACMISVHVFKAIDYQFLLLALTMIIGFIIPNHILNKKHSRHV